MLDIEELAKMAASYPTIKRFIAEMNSMKNLRVRRWLRRRRKTKRWYFRQYINPRAGMG